MKPWIRWRKELEEDKNLFYIKTLAVHVLSFPQKINHTKELDTIVTYTSEGFVNGFHNH